MSSESWPPWIRHIVAPVIVAVIIGAGTAYVTTMRLADRVDAHERRLIQIEKTNAVSAQAQGDIRERLVRLETKIDLLLTDEKER